MKLHQLAEITGSELLGDPNCEINGVASIENASSGELSFVHAKKYQTFLATTKASAIILSKEIQDDFSGNRLVNNDPYLAYAKVVNSLFPLEQQTRGIHPTAFVHESANIAQGVSIGAHVSIAEGCKIGADVTIESGCCIANNCTIGEGSELRANVSLYENTQLGQRCLIHSGAVLGADGFGFAPQEDGKWYKISQIGNVVLGNDVEVGANTCIDCAALGSTIIEDGVKLDNLIQIGHNVSIGENTAIAAHTAVAGSVTIGKRCRIAGAVAIAGHLEIADDVTVTGTTMVSHSIRKAGVYSSGLIMDDYQSWRKNVARFRKLDELFRKVLKLEKHINKGQNK